MKWKDFNLRHFIGLLIMSFGVYSAFFVGGTFPVPLPFVFEIIYDTFGIMDNLKAIQWLSVGSILGGYFIYRGDSI